MTAPKDSNGPSKLDRAIEELRAEPIAELDWERVWSGVEAGTRRHRPPAPRTTFVLRVLALAVPVAAAAATVALTSWHAPEGALAAVPTSAAGTSVGAAPSVTQAAHREGERVVAIDRVERQTVGLARTSFAPGTVAWIRSATATQLTVELERGELEADVVPGQPDRYVVLAGSTRVSVKGTRFVVARDGDSTRVSVSRGRVAVTRAHGEPVLLGAGESLWVQPVATLPALTSAAAAQPLRSGQPVRSPEARPVALSTLEATLRVADLTRACFDRETPEGSVRLSVNTRLDVVVAGGSPTASFDPPLAPNVEACVRAGLGALGTVVDGTASRSLYLAH